jgi:hypothetical protein
MTFYSNLLTGAALLSLAVPAAAQQSTQAAPATEAVPAADAAPPPADAAPPPADAAADPMLDDYGEGEEIVIQGQRARGTVVGDIPPENTLDSRDVRATGATSINELLEALAPQIGSAQGRGGERPVLLLNGQRISSFREMRDIPTEAIERVEILPEEVALKYGYRADQKVVNIVLRERFRSTVAQVGAGVATEGGYSTGNADLTRLSIQKNGRTQFNLHAEGNGMLTENERNILSSDLTPGSDVPGAGAARSLIGTKRDVRGSATLNRQVFGDVSGTFNAELEHNEGRSLIGLGEDLLAPLARNSKTDTAHAGFVLNGTKHDWRWSLTGNGDLEHQVSGTDRDDVDFPRDRSRGTTRSGDLKLTANGKLFALPAGDATSTVTLAGSTVHLDSHGNVGGDPRSSSLGRTTGEAAVNIDLPISRRNRDFSALGNFTLNANAEVDRLSDFGTLTTIGAGANLSPLDRLNLIASWTREEGPPSINQLGDAVQETPGTRIFDFTNGETVLVKAITGGNPDLQSDKRTVTKLSANFQPFEKTDLRFRADYVHQTIDRPVSNLTVTPAIEAAFPDRFERDSDGDLVRVDLRPVNFDSSRRDTLRIGFDFSKPLKSRRPSQSVMDQIRSQFRRGGPAAGTTPTPAQPQAGGISAPATSTPGSSPPAQSAEGGPPPAPPTDTAGGRVGYGRGGGGGGRGGGGFFGGGSRGRLQFSLTDTITFVDKVRIAPGLELDYLHGDASGQSGGTPTHKVEAQAGWSNNGLGARLGANWRSATRVSTLTGDDLHFSSLATFDLRLFANPGDIPELVVKHPWLRGTQFRLEVSNLFDSKPRVRDAASMIPLNYQPDLLDPLGRTISISIRKLFLPSPSWYRQQRASQSR